MVFAVINRRQSDKLARSIGRFRFAFDDYTEPLLYPSKNADPVASANFFFFLVAIDHRTHRRGEQFKGRVGGLELVGAELLWALAKERFSSNPSFFSPARLSKVSTVEIEDLFSVDGVVVSGPRA